MYMSEINDEWHLMEQEKNVIPVLAKIKPLFLE